MTMMMSFYKKSLHSFLSFTDNLSSKSSSPFNNYSNPHLELHHALGLGLINSDHNNAMQLNKSPNILESSSLIKPPLSSSRKDPGGVGFIDDVGGGVDGLMSCTESLGFESSDERLVNDELTMMEDCGGCMSRVRRRKVVAEERKFPPPLTSLNQHGHPNFYLRSVRKDGRLELTEVRIERTEILRACRGDGRLRLHLIKDEEQGEKDGGDGDNEGGIEEEEEEEEKNKKEEEEEEEEEEVEGLVKEGKMEFRRCVEMINHQRRHEHHRSHHHHQHLDVWRQHCVTTS